MSGAPVYLWLKLLHIAAVIAFLGNWERWGAVALLTPVAALVLMVLKPSF